MKILLAALMTIIYCSFTNPANSYTSLLDGREYRLVKFGPYNIKAPYTLKFKNSTITMEFCGISKASYRSSYGRLITAEITGQQIFCNNGNGDPGVRLLLQKFFIDLLAETPFIRVRDDSLYIYSTRASFLFKLDETRENKKNMR